MIETNSFDYDQKFKVKVVHTPKKIRESGVNVIKLFSSVIYECS
jgi:hypothetical protein